MRLICPNCGAQYAVADDVIPPTGRDVQCSNCSHTWFEMPGGSAEDTPPPARTRPAPEQTRPEQTKPVDETPAPTRRSSTPQRSSVNPDVADILREEAARETARRRDEAPAPVETQTDLGLSEPPRQPRRPERAEKVRKAAPAAAAAAATAAAAAASSSESRRPKLPEIDDIDPVLKDKGDVATEHEIDLDVDADKRRRFRRGFFLVLVLIAILVAIYVQAPRIKAAIPAAGPSLDSYVAMVDGARIWLDETIRGLLVTISGEG